jgi:hypothetical protein
VGCGSRAARIASLEILARLAMDVEGINGDKYCSVPRFGKGVNYRVLERHAGNIPLLPHLLRAVVTAAV